ncbi:YciK family oxidoreductase [Salinispirillum sp. LH 10-3-1]|uniref:YciK family oxidoreductase n=1 Tax=Salinispirillum sp. LH 10-3-1 TaxID=2952525 RepID=A0AB38YBM8_9GAMM
MTSNVAYLDLQDFAPSHDLLHEKTILVTGAGSGIGASTAKAYAAHGATVILLGRTLDKLQHTYDAIVEAGHPEPILMPFDLETSDAEPYHQMAAAIGEQFGALDGLVHSAAVLGQRTPLSNYNHGAWETVFQINVHGAFHLTKALLPVLEAAPAPRILFLTSSVGREGRPYWGAYAASKFAVEGMAQVLAGEVVTHPDFCVNVVNPGRTRTAMRATAYPGEDVMTVPAPESHNGLMLYLMSSHCAGTNGLSFDAQK